MNRWLARFAFSFFVLGLLLLWSAYKEGTASPSPRGWRIGLYCVGAGVSIAIAVRGIRERHRPDED